VTPRRVFIGRDVKLVREMPDGVDLAGRIRLRPGHSVDLVLPPRMSGEIQARRALVWSWTIVSLGSSGPMYRGLCRWE